MASATASDRAPASNKASSWLPCGGSVLASPPAASTPAFPLSARRELLCNIAGGASLTLMPTMSPGGGAEHFHHGSQPDSASAQLRPGSPHAPTEHLSSHWSFSTVVSAPAPPGGELGLNPRVHRQSFKPKPPEQLLMSQRTPHPGQVVSSQLVQVNLPTCHMIVYVLVSLMLAGIGAPQFVIGHVTPIPETSGKSRNSKTRTNMGDTEIPCKSPDFIAWLSI